MAKKDFTAAASRVMDSISDAQNTTETRDLTDTPVKRKKERKTYSEAETQEFIESGHTSGRKGVKLSRINMAFTPENYDFIRTMARVRGETITSFVNSMVSQYREEHGEIYRKALEFRDSM